MPPKPSSRLSVDLQIAAFLLLPGAVVAAQKTFYDTLYAYKGWPRPRQESASFPSGGAHFPSFSLIAPRTKNGDADNDATNNTHNTHNTNTHHTTITPALKTR